MKKKHTRFITGLLSSPKLSLAQRDKVVELALRDLGKNESDELIIKELQLIKEKLGITEGENKKRIPISFQGTPLAPEAILNFLAENSEKDIGRRKELKKEIELSKNLNGQLKDQKSPVTIEKMSDEDLEKLFEKVIDPTLKKGENHFQTQKNFPKLHKPRELVEIIKTFSNNNNPLKYTTHSWEYGKFKSYEDFINQIKKEWGLINHELKKLNYRLHAKISNFLFNESLGHKKNEENKYVQVWGEKRVKIGWSSPELKDYCEENVNTPFYYPIPLEKQDIDNKQSISYFYEAVDIFKEEIEFREDTNRLNKIFLTLWEDVLSYDFKLSLQGTEGISFYSDVPWIQKSIKLIFESIRKRPEFQEVKIIVERFYQNNFCEVHIIHFGSKCTRSIEDPKINCPTNGDLSSLMENFKNLCDWSISAEFPDGKSRRLNFLSSSKTEFIEEISGVEGFTHTLRFYL